MYAAGAVAARAGDDRSGVMATNRQNGRRVLLPWTGQVNCLVRVRVGYGRRCVFHQFCPVISHYTDSLPLFHQATYRHLEPARGAGRTRGAGELLKESGVGGQSF